MANRIRNRNKIEKIHPSISVYKCVYSNRLICTVPTFCSLSYFLILSLSPKLFFFLFVLFCVFWGNVMVMVMVIVAQWDFYIAVSENWDGRDIRSVEYVGSLIPDETMAGPVAFNCSVHNGAVTLFIDDHLFCDNISTPTMVILSSP